MSKLSEDMSEWAISQDCHNSFVVSYPECGCDICAIFIPEVIRLEDQRDRLLAACEAGYEVLAEITNSRKGSIGSIDNTYLPQLNRERIDSKLEQLKDAITKKVINEN